MQIAPLDVHDPAQAEELFALEQAVHAADRPDDPPPLRGPFLASLRQVHPEIRLVRLTARVDGEIAGIALLVLMDVDNRHMGWFELKVSPGHRRRGVGRALLDRVAARAREEQRRVLIAQASRPVPGGPARSDAGVRFLTAMGFAPALENFRRRIDLTAVDEADEERLLAECLPRAEGYQRISWLGETPEPLADGVARLYNRLITDAPMGDMDLESFTLDADRLHADERDRIARQNQLVGVAARHRATGEVAAVTGMDVRAAGDHGFVTVTIADPQHRGHRLGTIVKIDIHRLVRRTFPQLRYVITGNADTNTQMASINERLGFVAYEASTNFQRKL